MAAYVTQTEIRARYPDLFVQDAMADTNPLEADAGLFDQIAAAASLEIDGTLAGVGAPFAQPFPALVRHAATLFVVEMLWQRRNGPADWTPFSDAIKTARQNLRDAAKGLIPLTPPGEPGAPIPAGRPVFESVTQDFTPATQEGL